MSSSRALAIILTFHYVCFAWIFFRATDFGGAVAVLAQIAEGTVGAVNLTPTVLALLAAGAATHLVPRPVYRRLIEAFAHSPAVVQAAALVMVGLLLRELAVVEVVPFLYFQF